MMSKGSFFMNESLKKGAPMVTDITTGVFMARGRLAFPQGLLFLSDMFVGRVPADVYAHSFFVERQENPAQPSPQFHLTEELQGVMRVVKGLTYMRDESCRLDNAMTVITDPATGHTTLYNPIELSDESLHAFRQRLSGSRAYLSPVVGVDTTIRTKERDEEKARLQEKVRDMVHTIVFPTRQTFGSIGFWAKEFPGARLVCSGEAVPGPAAAAMVAGHFDNDKAAAEACLRGRVTFVRGGADTPAGPPDAPPPLVVPEATLVEDYSIDAPLQLSPTTQLLRVPGDHRTNELVALDRATGSLACTDLFHGGYADFDPLNTWMCRVWGKFNRNGDFKDTRALPLYRRKQIDAQQGMPAMQDFVSRLITGRLPLSKSVAGSLETPRPSSSDAASAAAAAQADRFPLTFICHSHGTPPTRSHAPELMLAQYDLHVMERAVADHDVQQAQFNPFSMGRVQ